MSEAIVTDKTLTIEDAPADAKATGDRISNLQSLVGSPLTASTAASMTDTNKVYVYTGSETGYTNGNWYYHDGTSWVSGGVYNSVAVDLDSTLTVSGKAPDSKIVGDTIETLNKDITNLIMEPEETEADFYVCDRQGNVIVEFADGHIVTKNFDSSTLPTTLSALSTAISGKIATQQSASDAGKALVIGSDGVVTPAEIAPEIEVDATLTQEGEAADAKAVGDALQNIPSDVVKEVAEGDADLYICDNRGNVVAKFSNGGIQTKKFDSDDVLPPIETFSTSKTFARGSINTLTINATFRKGDEIYFHLADDNRYDAYGRYASYYEGSKLIFDNRRGSNGYVRHVISADCASVGITIGGTEYTDGTELTLYVYRKNGDVQPKVVTVKADGTGMFTTLKAAVDSITDANHLTNPYVIEVYPGIYDTLEGFTEEEIQSADEGGSYGQDTIVGVKLTDGISLIGVGRADDIILTAELDTTNYSSGVRGNISTLNTEGEMSLENVTIIGKNLRYCVHDDFRSPVNSHDKRIIRNCKFKGTNLSYAPIMTTYGAGMGSPRDYLIENCEFGYDLGIHTGGNFSSGCTIEINNCSGFKFRIGDKASAESDAMNRVIINNCNFQIFKVTHSDNTFVNHMPIEGTGNEQTMIYDLSTTPYRLGMIDLAPSGIATGKMVKRASGNLIYEVATDKAVACGVVIGSDADFAYVQKCGYIASNYLGLTGLIIGDYLTVDNSGSVVTGGTASNAIAIVKAVDSDGVAYAHLLI